MLALHITATTIFSLQCIHVDIDHRVPILNFLAKREPWINIPRQGKHRPELITEQALALAFRFQLLHFQPLAVRGSIRAAAFLSREILTARVGGRVGEWE